MKIRDDYDNEIASITNKIAAHDSDVENLDVIFQRTNDEHKAAAAALEQAKSVVDGIVDEKKDIKQRYDEGLKERSDLQVSKSSYM